MLEDVLKLLYNGATDDEIYQYYLNEDKEETFLFIIKDYIIKEDKNTYPDSVFYLNSDGKVLFELKNSTLWCNLDLVWGVFYYKYGMNYNEIQSFIKDMVEKHFKLKDVTPQTSWVRVPPWWKNISN